MTDSASQNESQQWNTGICQACKAIPFLDLPSEEQPALAHHSSLEALSASGATCSLCVMIHDALRSTSNTYADEELPPLHAALSWPPGATGVDRQYHGKFGVQFRISEAAGVKVSHMALRSPQLHSFAETGRMDMGGRAAPPLLPENYRKFDSAKDPGKVRPWLYGNWWTLPQVPGCPPQLIGLGVRASRLPAVAATEGGSLACVTYRGTDIRVLADPGRSLRSLPYESRP
ncbi:hypothetical protein IMZ48_08595 [Candidatus Bathyarchaeota archaeon]|nr:hypothetical protein [Candidatus Bathyarchaeota archaeon]